MKKLLVIMSVLLLSVAALTAQDRSVSRVLGTNYTMLEYQGVAADTLGISVDTLEYTLRVDKNVPVLHNIQVKTDTVSTIDGTVTAAVLLQGRIFSTDSWSNIDVTNAEKDVTEPLTVNFYSDLSAVIDTTAANTTPFYRQYRVLILFDNTTGLTAGEQVKLDWIYWKFYER